MRVDQVGATLIGMVLLAAGAVGQGLPDPGLMMGGPMFGHLQMKTGMAVEIEDSEGAPVKGAPFCATVTTEHTQSFADGNRIHTTDNSLLCRDSEGRTRREANLNMLGTVPQKSSAKLVTIVDPVAGVRYLLDGNDKTARKMPSLSLLEPGAMHTNVVAHPEGGKTATIMVREERVAGPGAGGGEMNVMYRRTGHGGDEPAPTTENLGDQTIEGIHATGTRMTTTIPAGQMGNEQPMAVTSERWYSPELKVTVMTKHNDPWAGELKTQFTNVTAGEPDRSLFTVPADYKVVDEKEGPFKIRIDKSVTPAQ